MITTFIVGSFFIWTVSTLAANTDIVINEIGAYPTSTHEWVEIWNKGSEAVDLTGWKFWESSTNHSVKASSTAAIVAPGEYGVICQDEGQFIIDNPFFTGSIFDSSWSSLSEAGEEIGLEDSEGVFVEKFTYIPISEFSLERSDPSLADYATSNWQEHASGNTLGAVNSNFGSEPPVVEEGPSSTIPWEQIKINEFVSDPATGTEWVELFSASTSSADLAGGYICDSRDTTSTCKSISGTIESGGWLVIDLDTDSYLNNGGDSVILKNADGVVVDEVVYGSELAAEKGESVARKTDGEDTDSGSDWAITLQITPGAANVIVPRAAPLSSSGGGSGSSASEPAKTVVKTSTTTTAQKKAKENEVNVVWRVKAPTQGDSNERLTFDASASADPRGGRLTFLWDFGDGSAVSSSKADHMYSASGTYAIVIYATSTAGTVDDKKMKINIGPGQSIANARVEMTEIFSNPVGVDTEEFIEIHNSGSSTADLSGWVLRAGDKEYEMPAKTLIEAGGFLVFERVATKLTLGNNGGRVELVAPDKSIADRVLYEKSKQGESYCLCGGYWQIESQPSPWESCIVVSTTSSSVDVSVSSTTSAENRTAIKSQTAKKSTTVKKTSSTASRAKVIAKPRLTDLSGARTLEKGTGVIVHGIVSALPGIFGTQYFYISDNGSGLQIYQNKKLFPELRVGDSVEVKGTVSVANGIKRVNVKSAEDIDILAIEQTLIVVSSTPAELNEEFLGALVKVTGEITEIKSNYMYIDDGEMELIVYFKKGAQIDKKKFVEGELAEITGVLEQAKTGLQVWPRSQDDVQIVGASEDLLKKQAETGNENQKEVAEKYLTATAGGITTLLLGFLARARLAFLSQGAKKIAAVALGIFKNKV